jgi:hypothetical protein
MKTSCLTSIVASAALVLCFGPPAGAQSSGSKILDVDFRKLVSRADLNYDKPASRSEEGMPIGNGRMGSLVWTSPSALKFQINRVDVFAENSYTTSFPRADTDYASGCGYVDINLVQSGEQRLRGRGIPPVALRLRRHDDGARQWRYRAGAVVAPTRRDGRGNR